MAEVQTCSVEWPDKTRCPALPRLSYLHNKVGSVSSCLRRRRLCDSVVVPLVILRQLSFNQTETAQQDFGEEDPSERMYMWSEWAHRSHFYTLCSAPRSLLIQVLGAKTQRWLQEKGKLEILKYSREDARR